MGRSPCPGGGPSRRDAIEEPEIILRLGAALAIGLLIGFERGWEVREREEGSRIAGFRTFGVVGLLGGVSGLLAGRLGAWTLAGPFLALGLLVAVAHYCATRKENDQSITTLAALLAGFALGTLAGIGEIAAAGAAAVVLAALLGTKTELHGLLQLTRREELLATIRLLLISVVILPVLPDRGFGPYEALNPYRLWWMVVLVAALSYVGYVAVRLMGPRRGILLTALFGGLASSTAVTLNLARLGRDKALTRPILAAGVVTASAVMFPRALVVAVALAPALLVPLAGALLSASAVGLLAAWWLARRAGDGGEEVDAERLDARNPLDLAVALKFGALLAVVMLLARAATDLLGGGGLIALAAASGLADVDAITLSVAGTVREGGIGMALAVAAILTAVAVNTGVKAVLVGGIAGWRAGAAVAWPLLAALAAGAAGAFAALRL